MQGAKGHTGQWLRTVSNIRRVDPIWLPIAAVLLIGAFLRYYHLGIKSLWLDELGHATVAIGPWGPMLEGIRGHAGAAPLDYIGVKFVTDVLGHGTTATRAWSWMSGVAGVGAICWLGWEAFRSRAIAIGAGLLLAISAFHIAYSQEVRFYALSVLVGTLAMAAFLRAARSRNPRWWVVFAVMLTASLYTHYFLVSIPLALGIALAIAAASQASKRRERLRLGVAFGTSLLFAAIAFMPWAIFAVVKQASAQHLFPTPDISDPTAYLSAFEAVLAPHPVGTTPSAASIMAAGTIGVFALLGVISARPDERLAVLGLTVLLVVMAPLAFLVDARTGYFFAPRQIIVVLVPIFVLAAAGAVRLAAMVGRHVRVSLQPGAMALFACSAMLLAAPSLMTYYATPGSVENWRKAATTIDSGICPGGRVFSNIGRGYSYGIGYYEPHLLPAIIGVETAPGESNEALLERILGNGLRSTDWSVLRAAYGTGDQVNTAIRYMIERGFEYDWSYGFALVTPPETCTSELDPPL